MESNKQLFDRRDLFLNKLVRKLSCRNARHVLGARSA